MKTLAISFAFLIAAQVTLTWNDNSNNEDGFRLERAEGTNAMLPLVTLNKDTNLYVDDTVVNGRSYSYRVVAFNTAGNSAPSNTATVSIPPIATVPAGPTNITLELPGEFANISTRGSVTATDTTIIPGFIVNLGPRRCLIRVVGPRLGQPPFNVPDVCADPSFTVINSANQQVVASNDNWSGQEVIDATDSIGVFQLPVGSKDAAVVVTLQPGSYTVVVRGVGAATGVALAEVYKLP